MPVSAVLLLIGFVPGMPNLLFIVSAIVAATAGFLARRVERKREIKSGDEDEVDKIEEESDGDQLKLEDVTDYSPVSVQLGYGLVEMVDDDTGGPLVERITGIRKQVSKALGFIIPAVRIRDDLTLSSNQYRIRIGQTIVGDDVIYPDRKLAIPGDDTNIKLDGIEVKDPSFGMDATWVLPSQQNEAEEKGYVVVAPESVLATHLSQIFYKHSGKLIGQDDVQTLLDNLSQTAPSLVESLVPKLVPLHNLTGVLRELLSERVPISDLRIILESLAGLVGKNLSVIETAEAIRPNLAGLLIQQVAPLNKALPVITFNSELEHMLIKMAKQNGEEGLVLDNELATKLISNISDLNQKLVSEGNTAVLVVSPNIRRQISGIIRQHVEDLIVLSFTELPDNRKVNVVATIDGGS